MPGIFITFEGLDGAGKTTQLEMLAAKLSSLGHDVITTREPGGTLLGDQVRELVKQDRDVALSANTQLLLFASSFAQKWSEVIEPGLASSKIILCDRWYHSTIAYQAANSDTLSPEYIEDVCLTATYGAVPNATFFFDLDPAERAKRLKIRGGSDAIEALGEQFFTRVRANFQELSNQHKLTTIDANGTTDEVFARLDKEIKKLIPMSKSA